MAHGSKLIAGESLHIETYMGGGGDNRHAVAFLCPQIIPEVND